MSKNIDTLLKYLSSKNIALELDEEQRQQIADDVILGCRIDEDTRTEWLETNKQAVSIIKNLENSHSDGLYEGQSKVIFPLLAPAVIQLAARMSQHAVRNNRTVECAVLGPDQEVPDPEDMQEIAQRMMQQQQQMSQMQQAAQQNPQMAQQMASQQQPIPKPNMIWVKADRARRVTSYMNYELLIESDTWLQNEHKLNSIVASWGIGFKQIYYDYVTKKNCIEIVHPENVIINQKVSCLDEAPRITIRHFLTKNQIIEYINAGYFLDIDLDELNASSGDETEDSLNYGDNDSEEKQPVYEFLCQTCYIDLDDDEYLEPYKCYVEAKSRKLLSIVPAFEADDLNVSQDGKTLISINRRLDIVDRHLIDSPDGNYYSLGLNSLLLHSNKSITTILRQLIDAGTLSNAASVSGFVTKAFKTKERSLRLKLGEFTVLDCNPSVDPTKQIVPMPFREPSQVLLALMQFLVESSQKNGFISDILTGDVEMQNVPATTSLAMVEQSTRAFKPIIAKYYMSLKKEFKMLFHLNSKYLDGKRYAKFQDDTVGVSKDDFNENDLMISPVADPTLSSEAHGFAQVRALIEGLQVFGPVTNMQEAALRFYSQLQFNEPEKLIMQPQPPPPDPKMMDVQLKAQIAQQKTQIDQMALQLEAAKLQNEKIKLALQAQQVQTKMGESQAKKEKMQADAMKDVAQASIAHQQAQTAARTVDVEEQKVEVMKHQAESQRIVANKPDKKD